MPEPQHDENASAPTIKRLGREIRWDAAAAIIASLVGLLALAVAGYTAYIQRQQVRAQVWPYLLMAKSNAGGRYELTAINKGVGPVIVRSVQVLVDGKPVPDWKALDHLSGFKPSGEFVLSTLNQTVLAPGDQVHWIRFDNAADINAFVAGWVRLHAEAQVCYSSTLGESWILTYQPDSGTNRREVSSCPNLPIDAQFDG